ncbi:MAG TPA: prolipoprotein diacylglyceryl transferase [bacterium]|nr:prolipoprotein diacylglyceryl transferase [bacterium]HPN44886.1 prolipoprotein diacylglyceryl transferase [bacterium]
MHPVLVKLGAFEIRAYGVMLALSFLFGIFLAIRRAKKVGLDPNTIMDLSVILIISAIVGSRFLYVVYHPEEFRGHWIDAISPFQSDGTIGMGGLTLLGGVILCFISSIIFLRVKKLPFLKFADVVIPSVGLGIFLTRIGCFFNGCCFGLPCEAHGPGHFCFIFPSNSAAGFTFPDTALIPTQLYSSLAGLIIFGILLYAERWKRFDGFLLYLFFILYGIKRFTIDLFRFYESGMIIFTVGEKGISLNQGISLVFIMLGIVLLIVCYTKKKE